MKTATIDKPQPTDWKLPEPPPKPKKPKNPASVVAALEEQLGYVAQASNDFRGTIDGFKATIDAKCYECVNAAVPKDMPGTVGNRGTRPLVTAVTAVGINTAVGAAIRLALKAHRDRFASLEAQMNQALDDLADVTHPRHQLAELDEQQATLDAKRAALQAKIDAQPK